MFSTFYAAILQLFQQELFGSRAGFQRVPCNPAFIFPSTDGGKCRSIIRSFQGEDERIIGIHFLVGIAAGFAGMDHGDGQAVSDHCIGIGRRVARIGACECTFRISVDFHCRNIRVAENLILQGADHPSTIGLKLVDGAAGKCSEISADLSSVSKRGLLPADACACRQQRPAEREDQNLNQFDACLQNSASPSTGTGLNYIIPVSAQSKPRPKRTACKACPRQRQGQQQRDKERLLS